MPEKQFVITTKTDAAAAAVEQLLAELQDSIDVQESPTTDHLELDEATLKLLDERLKEAENEEGIPWEEAMQRLRKRLDARENG